MTMAQATLQTHARPAALSPPRRMALAGKRVLVLGLGDTGLSVARWVVREGGHVRVADTRADPPQLGSLRTLVPAADARCGEFTPRLLEGVDLVCVSPGLSLQEAVVRDAVASGVPVCGDIELFAWGLAEYGRGKVPASAMQRGGESAAGRACVCNVAWAIVTGASVWTVRTARASW